MLVAVAAGLLLKVSCSAFTICLPDWAQSSVKVGTGLSCSQRCLKDLAEGLAPGREVQGRPRRDRAFAQDLGAGGPRRLLRRLGPKRLVRNRQWRGWGVSIGMRGAWSVMGRMPWWGQGSAKGEACQVGLEGCGEVGGFSPESTGEPW